MLRGETRVLFVTPELAPWSKVGGLGEVSRDLPCALASAGLDVRILVPAYSSMKQAFPDAACVAEIAAPGGALAATRLLLAQGAVPIYLVDCPDYFARDGIYQSPEGADWPDNHLRFGLLSRIAALLAGPGSPLRWHPHVVHCHDWQSGLTAAYLAHAGGNGAATVMTVHNLAYQGVFAPQVLSELGISWETFTLEGLEYYGNVSFLKAGLSYATQLTTVSPNYALEIQRPELGFGLDPLLRRRSAELSGILNGIDLEAWDPARDSHLARNYDSDRLQDKLENKIALQRACGLREAAEAPLFGVVSRMVWQKGLDVLAEAADGIVGSGAQIVVHGEGEQEIEHALRALAARHPGEVAVLVGYAEPTERQIVAGADAFLVPSRYEPCGLTQLRSQRYGTVSVARRTGGLAASVTDASEENLRAGTATGFTFDELTACSLQAVVARAISAYRNAPLWRSLQRNGMA
jgi:starch synthase